MKCTCTRPPFYRKTQFLLSKSIKTKYVYFSLKGKFSFGARYTKGLKTNGYGTKEYNVQFETISSKYLSFKIKYER